MHGRVTAAFLSLLLGGFLAIAGCQGAQSAMPLDSTIAVTGNGHVDVQMIRSHFHAGTAGRLDAGALDAALKSLYATGLFQDVKISQTGDRVLVSVVENPTIARLVFEGNKKIKDEDLKKALQSKDGGPLSRAIVHGDVEHVIALYRQRGYFDVRVEPKTIDAKYERVNLVFEIKEGDKLAVKEMRFVGNKAFPQNKLQGVIKTGTTNFLSFLLDNDGYDADRIEGDLDLIRRFYLAHGYADARVRSVSTYEAGKKGLVVTFTIEEGRQYRFGRVDIESAVPSIDAAVLRRYLRTHPGEIYDTDAVSNSVDAVTIGLARSGKPFATVLPRSERLPECG